MGGLNLADVHVFSIGKKRPRPAHTINASVGAKMGLTQSNFPLMIMSNESNVQRRFRGHFTMPLLAEVEFQYVRCAPLYPHWRECSLLSISFMLENDLNHIIQSLCFEKGDLAQWYYSRYNNQDVVISILIIRLFVLNYFSILLLSHFRL